jgi:beta-phosphoglucomutase-like phosphatase (HAD superfamily)
MSSRAKRTVVFRGVAALCDVPVGSMPGSAGATVVKGGRGPERFRRAEIAMGSSTVMGKLKALIFDVDGTLADTEHLHLRAFNAAFADADLDWHWSVPLYGTLLRVAGSRERIRHFIDEYHPDLSHYEDREALVSRLGASKNRYYAQLVRQGEARFRPGVGRLIKEARGAGLQLAIASTAQYDNIRVLLEANLGADAIGPFAVIAAGDVVEQKKPSPAIYRWVLEQLQADARDCIAFEDSQNGVCSAVGANVRTVVTVNDFTIKDDFADASIVLDCLGEPGQPFRVFAGSAGPATFVDLPFLRRLVDGT